MRDRISIFLVVDFVVVDNEVGRELDCVTPGHFLARKSDDNSPHRKKNYDLQRFDVFI